MFCTNCGSAQNDEAKFCTDCGAPFVSLGAPAPARFPWKIVAIVAAVVLLLSAAAVALAYDRGMFGSTSEHKASKTSSGKDAKRSTSSDAKDDSKLPEEQPETEQSSGLSAKASYSELQRLYDDVGYLSGKLGVAFTDGTYGGTGFAYEVFNPSIGSNDRVVRAALVDKTAAMLAEIESSLASARELQIAPDYQSDYENILALYELLEARAAVLHDTAVVALDSPDESVWRPTLSPRSTEYREQFEVAYPLAEPVQR